MLILLSAIHYNSIHSLVFVGCCVVRACFEQASKRMAGLVKAKKYDWKDSNLALFGSDQERKVAIRSIGLL